MGICTKSLAAAQRRSAALGSRRQDARRGLCYAGKRGEIGGVIEPRIHLSQAAKLSRNPGPPLARTGLITEGCKWVSNTPALKRNGSSQNATIWRQAFNP